MQECTPDYRALPSGNHSPEIRCVCFFDLLELNDKDLRLFPLVAGKQKLGVLVLLGAVKEHDIADPSFVDELNSSGWRPDAACYPPAAILAAVQSPVR